MKIMYDVDGKSFENKEDALKFEKEKKEKEEAEKKKSAEKKDRIAEIEKKERELNNLKEKFWDDYGYWNGFIPVSTAMERFFDII